MSDAKLYSKRPPHPGRTAAQRRVLDAIGCGESSPRMSPKVRDALLTADLIVQCGERVVCQDRFGTVTAPEYAMPIPVHMQWCSAIAATDAEMAKYAA